MHHFQEKKTQDWILNSRMMNARASAATDGILTGQNQIGFAETERRMTMKHHDIIAGIPVYLVNEEGEQIKKHKKKRINKKWLKRYEVYHTGIRYGDMIYLEEAYGPGRIIMTNKTYLDLKRGVTHDAGTGMAE